MLKDLIDTFSPEKMCEYCTLSDECGGQPVYPLPSGEPCFSPCNDIEVYIRDCFDIDAYFEKNLDGCSLCMLCRNRKLCEHTLNSCKNIDMVKLPCHNGLSKDLFEKEVIDAIVSAGPKEIYLSAEWIEKDRRDE